MFFGRVAHLELVGAKVLLCSIQLPDKKEVESLLRLALAPWNRVQASQHALTLHMPANTLKEETGLPATQSSMSEGSA